MDLPLYHWRAQLAAIKLRMVARASELLGDASVQAAFLRLCGARIGSGSSLSEQVMLPETVEIGRDCFFASGNTLTSVVVDQGRLQIPTRTVVGDRVFLGNTNHISEGMPSGVFAGLHTWLPSRPAQDGASFFGNPAMRFSRPSAQEGEEVIRRGEVCWYHFSTSVVDLFFWQTLKSVESSVGFICGRLAWSSDVGSWSELLAELVIFAAVSVLSWYLMHLRFSNMIYNDRAPLRNRFYSAVIMRWFSANKIRKVFPSPFKTAGTMYHAAFMRAMGVQVGQRFFSPNEDVMIDPPFGRLGDDVTIDYDAQVRQHSFEDNVLKWGPNWVGSGTTILQGGCLAMCDAGEGVVLRRGSVTWKDMILEPDQEYEGAPAVPVQGPEQV